MVEKKKIPELMKSIIDSLREKKAENLKVLDVSNLVSYTDYLVIGSGNNSLHVQALADAVERLVKVPQVGGVRIEKDTFFNWVLVDVDDFIIHLFQPEARKFYRLEQLWEDAIEIEV